MNVVFNERISLFETTGVSLQILQLHAEKVALSNVLDQTKRRKYHVLETESVTKTALAHASRLIRLHLDRILRKQPQKVFKRFLTLQLAEVDRHIVV